MMLRLFFFNFISTLMIWKWVCYNCLWVLYRNPDWPSNSGQEKLPFSRETQLEDRAGVDPPAAWRGPGGWWSSWKRKGQNWLMCTIQKEQRSLWWGVWRLIKHDRVEDRTADGISAHIWQPCFHEKRPQQVKSINKDNSMWLAGGLEPGVEMRGHSIHLSRWTKEWIDTDVTVFISDQRGVKWTQDQDVSFWPNMEHNSDKEQEWK